MWHASRIDRQRAFTLIEVLVALAVFAIASLIAYRGLDAVASTKSTLDQEIRFWRELGLVFDRMDTDFGQSVPRPLQVGSDTLTIPLRGGRAGDADHPGFFIELARLDGNRAPVHVIYQCERGELTLSLLPIRCRSGVANSPAAGERGAVTIKPTRLLQHVEQCDAAFLNGANAWLDEWPGDQSLVKPRAIRVRVTQSGRGQFERVFVLP
ncbi:type II secretion system minor pseudopilin GspJ [Propionivibrio limicola]|uniref:type II secretion system minor pseudopilin GspJ n=1 Tax=Propionivibrio limicola TaxID=167645 RepID=UPI00129142FB|nr:type II secretion system minor pseudopilin GspJ [Propionivibrio limicola]